MSLKSASRAECDVCGHVGYVESDVRAISSAEREKTHNGWTVIRHGNDGWESTIMGCSDQCVHVYYLANAQLDLERAQVVLRDVMARQDLSPRDPDWIAATLNRARELATKMEASVWGHVAKRVER